MKRRDIKSTSLLLMVLLALIVTACGKNTDITATTVKEEFKTESGDEMKGYDFSTFENVEITGIDMDSLTDEERSILYVQAKYCQAMTDADIDTMRELVSRHLKAFSKKAQYLQALQGVKTYAICQSYANRCRNEQNLMLWEEAI